MSLGNGLRLHRFTIWCTRERQTPNNRALLTIFQSTSRHSDQISMAFTSSADYSLWPTEAPSNPTPCGRPHGLVGKMKSITSAASQVPTNAPSNHTSRTKNGVSQLLEQRQFAEYQKSLSTTPILQRANHSPLPIPVGPPPSFPSRRPVDSPLKSDVVPSTVCRSEITRIQRTTSDGCVILQPGERFQSLVQVTQPKPPRSSDSSPKPPRQSNTRNSFDTPSALTSGSGMRNGDKSPFRSVHGAAEKPQLRRRPSVDISRSSRHRRSHSADIPRGERLCRSTSIRSLTSYALDSEAVKMLPDPRWGGGVNSISRSRSFSSENIQSMVSIDIDLSSSPDSSTPYGSIMGTDNKLISSVIVSTPIVDQNPKIQLSRSDISNSSFSSGVSIDRSVEPVMTDMTKSAMFKGVTNKGIVKLQLPKDNFRLLSDRDLGE